MKSTIPQMTEDSRSTNATSQFVPFDFNLDMLPPVVTPNGRQILMKK